MFWSWSSRLCESDNWCNCIFLGPPVVIQTFEKDEVPSCRPGKYTDLHSFCNNVRDAPISSLMAKKIPSSDRIYRAEYYSFRHFLQVKIAEKSPCQIIRVASSTHAGGTIMLGNFTLDGVLVLKKGKKTTLYLYEYNDAWSHGHLLSCLKSGPKDVELRRYSKKVMDTLQALGVIIENTVNKYQQQKTLRVKLVQYSNCELPDHGPIPHLNRDQLLQHPGRVPNEMSYDRYLNMILSRELIGFIGK